MKLQSRKICAGLYRVSLGNLEVSVTFFSRAKDGSTFTGWVAQSDWDRFLVTDPLQTKRDAMRNAFHMLQEAAQ